MCWELLPWIDVVHADSASQGEGEVADSWRTGVMWVVLKQINLETRT